jgi:hypothetical protein
MQARPVTPFCVFVLGGLVALTQMAAPAQASPSTMPVQILPLGAFHPDADSAIQPAGTAPVAAHLATTFLPAPMPDPDIDPPHGAAARGPSLSPAFFRHKEEFNGDGYAVDSDPDHGLDQRRTPAAGLNWSVPVK